MGQNSRLSDKAELHRPCTMTCSAPSRLISQKSYPCFQVGRKSEPNVSPRASPGKCSLLSSDPTQVHTNKCSLLSAPWFEDGVRNWLLGSSGLPLRAFSANVLLHLCLHGHQFPSGSTGTEVDTSIASPPHPLGCEPSPLQTVGALQREATWGRIQIAPVGLP